MTQQIKDHPQYQKAAERSSQPGRKAAGRERAGGVGGGRKLADFVVQG